MDLILHPACESRIEKISARIGRLPGGLSLSYTVRGMLSAIVIPPPADPARADELWRATCFELFIRERGLAYCEFNFSPSGRWAAYRFDSYRSGMRELELAAPPLIAVDRNDTIFTMTVSIPFQPVDSAHIGLSAVIEELDGRKSCWALAHPDGPPDFHHDACFAVSLADIAAS